MVSVVVCKTRSFAIELFWESLMTQHSKLTLQQSIEIYRSFEASNSQIRQINEQGRQDDVNKVKSTRTKTKRLELETKASIMNSSKNRHNTKCVDIVGESINLGENFVQRGARRVIRVEGEIILQSSAGKAEEIIQTKLKNLIRTLILNILIA